MGRFRSATLVAWLAWSSMATEVCAQPPTSPVTYQAGGSAGAVDTVCRAVQVAINGNPVTASNVQGPELELHPLGSVALVDFPIIIGTGQGQIPPGATITSALLQLWCTNLQTPTSTTRTVRATPVLDFSAKGTWFDPASSGVANGVSWAQRDGRPGANLGWTTTFNAVLNTSVAGLPSNAVVSNAFPDIQRILTLGGTGGPNLVNTWHSFDLTRMVSFWSNGVANQGVMLQRETSTGGTLLVRYASESATDPTKRPRLVITFSVPASPMPWNRVPRLLPAEPANPSTTDGQDLLLYLAAIDDDGTAPALRVLRSPSSGVLVGSFPFLTYRASPGFTGTDSFTYTAFDQLGSAFPGTVTISVAAASGQQFRVFQDGLSPVGALSAGQTQASHTTMDGNEAGNQSTFEETVIKCFARHRQMYLAFPNIIGTGAGQIPPGSRILDARLDLKPQFVSAPSVAALERSVTLARILNPLNRPAASSWREPAALGGTNPSVEYPCSGCGVSFLFPDTSAQSPSLWAFAIGTSSAQRFALGGDTHAYDVASVRVHPEDTNALLVKSADVTASVQAWAEGAPNLGWLMQHSDTTTLFWWSDNAPNPPDRPKLQVTFRAPGAGPPLSTLPPHADAGPDRAAWAGQVVVLDGRRSFQPNGLQLSYVWIQSGGPAVTLATPLAPTTTFTAPAVASGAFARLEFILATFDGTRYSVDDVHAVISGWPGTPVASPSVSAGVDLVVPELGTVGLLGSASGGSGAANLRYLWTQIQGPSVVLSSSTVLAPSFAAPGVTSAGTLLEFDLSIVDTGVPTGTSSVVRDQIRVRVDDVPGNQAPLADPGLNRSVEAGSWVELDGTATVDPEGQPLTFTWSQLSPAAPLAIGPLALFGNYVVQGTAGASITPFRAPTVASSTPIIFRMSVTDGQATNQADVTITVIPPLSSFQGSVAAGSTMNAYREALTKNEARHLLRRMGDGWHPDDVDRVRTLGLSTSVALALTASDSPLIQTELVNFGYALASPGNIAPELRQPFDPWPQLDAPHVEAYWLLHTLRTTAPLKERMIHFLNDRLCASSRNVIDSKRHWCLMHAEMLRNGSLPTATQTSLGIAQGAYGNWRDILADFSIDAVTLSFIEGFNNLNLSPNENFGREFFELHSLGVFDPITLAPNYSQADVIDGARAWTGYRPVVLTLGAVSEGTWYAAFTPFLHDYGLKTILSQTGVWGPADLPGIVLGYQGGVPASRFLAKGLLRHFVMENPPSAMIEDLSLVIRGQNWQLGPILGILLRSNAMFSASAPRSIVSTPVEFANGIARTLRIPLQTRDIVGGSGVSLKILLGFAQHVLSDPLDVGGFPKDTGWIDGFGLLKRSEIARQLLLWARAPTSPSSTLACQVSGGTPTTCGQYPYAVTGAWPWLAPAALDLRADFLPPPKARRGLETLELLLETLDLRLPTTSGTAGTNEKALALQYLDQLATASGSGQPVSYQARPFNGDDGAASQQNKIWGLVMLLLEHPDALRM